MMYGAPSPPSPHFVSSIVLGIFVVCNAEGQLKEQGGHDCPCHLKKIIAIAIIIVSLLPSSLWLSLLSSSMSSLC
jgi:hypothetical protein